MPVESGVPQGTVLGPILFLIHIHEISTGLSVQTSSSSFADDTRIWREVSTVNERKALQTDLNGVYKWAENVNMQFISKKADNAYIAYVMYYSNCYMNIFYCMYVLDVNFH